MAEELAALLEAVEAPAGRQTPVAEQVVGRTLVHGRLAGHEVVLARSGIGKVAAASTATLLVERAEAMLMVGTAGGIGEAVHPGDVVIAAELLQHDLDASPLFPRWQVPETGRSRFATDHRLTAALQEAADDLGAGVHTGLVVSGDVFVGSAAAVRQLRADLPDALAVEMEGAALAQVCAQAGVAFAVGRTISDRADEDAHLDFATFLAGVAAPYAHDLVIGALQRLP